MPDQLIYTDTNVQSATADVYSTAKAQVQAIVTLYGTMALPALTALEFPRLFNDTESLIYDKLTGGNAVTLQGLTLNKVKAMAIMEHPAGYEALIAQIATLRNDARMKGYGTGNARLAYSVENIDQYFLLGANATVGYSASSQAAIDYAGKSFVKTDKGKAFYAFAQDVVAAFFAHGLAAYGDQNDARQLPAVVAATIERINIQSQSFMPNVRELTTRLDRV